MAAVQRPLSAVERWYWLCDQFSTLNVIARVRVQGALSMTALRHGLDRLQSRHPLLRARITHQNGQHPTWVPCENSIPLRQVHSAREGQWVDEINDYELPLRVDPDTGPLMRTAVICQDDNTYDLLVVVPHVIADGTTVMSLAEQWLTLANTADSASWTARVLPPAEALLPPAFMGEKGAAKLAEQTAQDAALMATCKPARIAPGQHVPLDQRRTRLVCRELSRAQLGSLVQACRQHNATVHGAVTAALVLAAAQDRQHLAGYFAVGSPIDFRAELVPPVQPDEVGSYVATIHSVVDVSQPFWEVARAINADLTERKASGHHLNLVTLVVDAAPTSLADARPFMAYMEAEGPINPCSSNIGRYDFPTHIEAWRLSGAQFLTGISVNGYFVATINTSHDRLFWNFTYIKTVIAASRAERLADGAVRFLLSALEEPATVLN